MGGAIDLGKPRGLRISDGGAGGLGTRAFRGSHKSSKARDEEAEK